MAQQKAVEPVDEVEDLIDELQPGSKLLKGQYTITRYINSGGFGITYLAKDSLDRDVVIKECFPSSVCRRSKVVVAARSRAHTAELRSIVQLFVREARSLAKIVHPNIVAVHQVFEDNGTAYMAIDYIDGLDLQQIIDGEGEPLTPGHIVQVTEKLLHAVGFIHANDMLHRDISPDNVLIDKTGKPILIDFGAAREHASKATRAMSALRVVKDGYSPQEFYIAGSEQGPWSDLYALGATIYHLISGEAPVNGQARLAALAEDRPDPYVPLSGRFPSYPPGFLEAIDRALQTLPKQRLQSASAWLEMFHSDAASPALVAEAPAGVDDAVHRVLDDFKRDEAQSDVVVRPSRPLAKAASRLPEAPMPTAPAGRGRSPVQLVAGIAVALALVAGGYMVLGSKKVPAAGDAASTVADSAAEAATKSTDIASAAATVSLTPALTDPGLETAATETTAPAETPAATGAEVASAQTEPDTAELAVEPAAEAGTETATAETEAADPAETGPVETAAAEPTIEIAAEPAAEPAVEPAAETAAEPTATETSPEAEAQPTEIAASETPAAVSAATPDATQIAFAAWDVEMPFSFDDRMVDGKRVAVVTRFTPGIDAQRAGDWLAPGVTIHAVNGTPIDVARSLTVAVMNAMAVDPDGKARVVVEFSDSSQKRKTGLLTVGAVRLVSLQNGVAARVSVIDGAWRTTVSGVGRPDKTSLQPGDILFRDKTTSTALDGPDSLEKVLSDLVSKGATQTGFSVIRNNKVDEATMQLSLAKGQ
jgi:serine/threonine protein kinase